MYPNKSSRESRDNHIQGVSSLRSLTPYMRLNSTPVYRFLLWPIHRDSKHQPQAKFKFTGYISMRTHVRIRMQS